jgi:hypothetical protein
VSDIEQSAAAFAPIVWFHEAFLFSPQLSGCVACVHCNGRPGSNSSSSSSKLCSLPHCTAGQRWHCPCPAVTHISAWQTYGATARAAHVLRCSFSQTTAHGAPVLLLPLRSAGCSLKPWAAKPSQQQ